MQKTNKSSTLFYAVIFILPFFLLYTMFVIWPTIQGFWVSLNKWSLMGRQEFIGLENYQTFIADRRFWEALRHTLFFTIVCAPLMVVLAMVLAMLANRATHLKHSLRVIYYLPSVLSVSVIAFIGKYMFSPYTGFINGALHQMGILAPDQELQWLQETNLAWVSIISITMWWTVGFSMLLYISALQDIPSVVYEAADIDGASKPKQLFGITIPLLKQTSWLVLLLQLIACLKIFGQIYMMTGGGPASSTRPIVQYIYEMAFDRGRLGYAAAMANVLFVIILIVSLIQQFAQSRKEE